MEQQIEEIKEKINKIEYVELKNLKDEVNKIKLDLNTDNLLTKQSIESNEKLTSAMDTLKSTMIELAQSVKDGNKVTSELATTVTSLNGKVNSIEDKMGKSFKEVDERIQEIDGKSKIDIITWIRNNWFGTVMGVGAVVYAVTQILANR